MGCSIRDLFCRPQVVNEVEAWLALRGAIGPFVIKEVQSIGRNSTMTDVSVVGFDTILEDFCKTHVVLSGSSGFLVFGTATAMCSVRHRKFVISQMHKIGLLGHHKQHSPFCGQMLDH